MVGVSSGLANGGKIPFVSAASCFLTGRALEQIKVDVAYSKANVKLVGQSPGIGYGELGPTHHSIEDFAWLRVLPNLAVVSPADPWETAEAVKAAALRDGPVFLRVGRFGVPQLPRRVDVAFAIGKAETLREGGDVAIIANGVMVARARGGRGARRKGCRRARRQHGVDCAARRRGDSRRRRPRRDRHRRGAFDPRRPRRRVAEFVVGYRPCPVRIVGFPEFMPTGAIKFLFETYGLTAAGIARAAEEAIALRRKP
jgi:transketolase